MVCGGVHAALERYYPELDAVISARILHIAFLGQLLQP
jgi:hypothetical protein